MVPARGGGGGPPLTPTPLTSFSVLELVRNSMKTCRGCWKNGQFYFEETVFVGSYLGRVCKQAVDVLAGVVPAYDHDYLRTVREDLTTVYDDDVAGRPS